MKSLLTVVNENSTNNNLKLSETERWQLLILDRLYGAVIVRFGSMFCYQKITNWDDEKNKFLKSLKQDKKYYPNYDIRSADKEVGKFLIGEMEHLKSKFESLSTFIKKYYIEVLDYHISQIKWYIGETTDISWFEDNVAKVYDTPKDVYDEAVKILQTTKKTSKEDKKEKDINAEEAVELIQKYIEDKGLEYKVKISPLIQSRMMMCPTVLLIGKNAKFTEDDIENLKQHEIEGHYMRQINSIESGLNLFKFGLLGYKILDEGLAVWNSYNRNDADNNDSLRTIAMRAVAGYMLKDYDFYEILDKLKELCPDEPESKLYGIIARAKRFIRDTKLKGGYSEGIYLQGYLTVKDLDVKTRNRCRKLRIAPAQIDELSDFERFIEINDFLNL